jgi:hypothetical protein
MASSTSDRVTPLQLQTYIQHFSESKAESGDCEAAAGARYRDAQFLQVILSSNNAADFRPEMLTSLFFWSK